MELVVGTDSTWSLRAWICGQMANMVYDIKVIDLTETDSESQILKYSPTGLVPVLKTDSLVIHDSLAIAEFFNERVDGALLPYSGTERAIARSLCAEMHSGFINLRSECPFTLDKVEPLSDYSNGIKNEIARLESIFEQAHLPFMFGAEGMVDAFYAILAYRLKTYGVLLKGKAGDYQQILLDWAILQEAIELAKTWKKA